MFLINFWLVFVFLVAFWSLKQAKNEWELCATLGNKLLSQSRDARKKIRERNSSWSNFAWWCEIFTCYAKFKGRKLQGKFGVLPRVHFLHSIYNFETREVRSPTLQIVCNLKLKWGSYGQLKATAQKLKRNFALTFPDAKIFALTFPNAKIFALTFPNAKIFALTFSDAKFFAPPFSNTKM